MSLQRFKPELGSRDKVGLRAAIIAIIVEGMVVIGLLIAILERIGRL